MAANKNKATTNNSTFEDGGVQFQRCGHTVPLERHVLHLRSALEKREEEVKAAQSEASEMKRRYEDQISRLSAALSQKQQEVPALGERAQRENQQQEPRMKELHSHYLQQLQKMNADLELKGKEAEYYKHSLSEKEMYIQRKMEEARNVLQQKDEQLKSFKDRVAGDVALSLRTGKVESMNNPVSKSRLKEMYDELRTLWPAVKKHLRSKHQSPESVKAKLQEVFSDAAANMEQQKNQIDKLYGLDEAAGRPPDHKVQEYRKATVQYVALTLYHSRKEDSESQSSLLRGGGTSLDVMDFLDSRCRWLGALLALNDPPLQPDWEDHHPGMDQWDLLPRNLRPAPL